VLADRAKSDVTISVFIVFLPELIDFYNIY